MENWQLYVLFFLSILIRRHHLVLSRSQNVGRELKIWTYIRSKSRGFRLSGHRKYTCGIHEMIYGINLFYLQIVNDHTCPLRNLMNLIRPLIHPLLQPILLQLNPSRHRLVLPYALHCYVCRTPGNRTLAPPMALTNKFLDGI